MVIGIDLDGVVCDFIGSLLRMEGRGELQGNQQDYYFPHKGDCVVYTEKQFMKAWDEFNAQHGFIGIKMISGAFEGIEELLKKKFEIVFVTDRKKESFRDTWYWMRLMGWLGRIPVVFSNGEKVKFLVGDNFGRISPIGSFGTPFHGGIPLVMVDDEPKILRGLNEVQGDNGILPICFDQSWNRDVPINVVRMYDWEELVMFIKDFHDRSTDEKMGG